MTTPVGFDPLRPSDFPLLSRWLAEPLVARWWHHDPSPAAVVHDFGPSVDGSDVAEFFLASLGQRRFGLIQRYAIGAYPEYVAELEPLCGVPEAAMSIDYLIGEPWARGKGYGTELIRQFVAKLWAECPEANDVVVPVHAGNAASWRALAGAGFVRIARGELEPDNPADSRDHVVYRISRPAAGAAG